MIDKKEMLRVKFSYSWSLVGFHFFLFTEFFERSPFFSFFFFFNSNNNIQGIMYRITILLCKVTDVIA